MKILRRYGYAVFCGWLLAKLMPDDILISAFVLLVVIFLVEVSHW